MESKIGGCRQRVKVVVRVRPQVFDDKLWVQVCDHKTLQTVNHRNTEESLQYEFESVYGPAADQGIIYKECVKPLLQKTLLGQNASVFAYGPTGAGKTHTILGTPDNPGVIPRCVKGVFAAAEEQKLKLAAAGEDWSYQVSYSYLEIYQEKVQDLLNPSGSDLPIREDQNHHIFVAGLSEKVIDRVEDFNKSFGPASKNRKTASTKLNERSSRSHSILVVKVERHLAGPPRRRLTGKLYIIDLAGSEDNRKTGNQGMRLKESGAINGSLLALGQVVDALNKGQVCVPYRGSKLTRLLQDSLGGSCHSCMIVNLSPEERHYFDTYTTLHFARKAKKIVNTVKTNEVLQKPPSVIQMKRKFDDGKDQSGSRTPPKMQKVDPAPFLSPILRKQEKFRSELREEVFSRLEELEGRLLQQMKFPSPTPENCESTDPDSTTQDASPHRRRSRSATSALNPLNPETIQLLENIKYQLRHLKQPDGHVVTTTSGSRENCRHGAEKSSESTREKNRRKSQRLVVKETVFSDGSTMNDLKTQDLKYSPLFAKPFLLKRKGFKSTASRSDADMDASENVSCNSARNPEFQKSHNADILKLLNEGTVKELQNLQTVGAKRAKLIHSWRELSGHFTTFRDLENIHGLTSKYVSNFLRSNLIQEL